MFVVALTRCDSVKVWSPIKAALPDGIGKAEPSFGNAGRLRTVAGVLKGMSMIGAIDAIAGIDPGRAGRGKLAEAIYDDEAGSARRIGSMMPGPSDASRPGHSRSGDMVNVGLIDRLLARTGHQGSEADIDVVMHRLEAGQRLAAENCPYNGARGLIVEKGADFARAVLTG